MSIRKIRFVICICFLSVLAILSGQDQHVVSATVKQVIDSEIEKIGLSKDEVRISSSHYSEHNQVHYIYLQQQFQNIDIWDVQANLVVRDKVEVSNCNKLIPGFATMANLEKQKFDPQDALSRVAAHFKMPFNKSKGQIRKYNDTYIISNLPYSRHDVTIKVVWSLWEGIYYKSWEVRFKPNTGSEDYVILVNGQSGQLDKVINRTISCHFDEHHSDAPKSKSPKIHKENQSFVKSNPSIGDGQYRVFEVPIESPNHGNRTIVESPADEMASPFGWHDTNRQQGAEYTITRGNNVHAYHDQSGDNESEGDEPDGGDKLVFDFPFDEEASIQENLQADVTNLFYWNNFVHDWSYQFGFNESAGNFQENNYGNGGRDGDIVRAETLDGEDVGNANFGAPEDGSRGRMQMYRWIAGGLFSVTNPISISGNYLNTVANFGPTFRPQVSGDIAIAQDGVAELGDACETIINATELSGNIALIDRGTCDFSFKVFRAQQAGAVACIVCNNLADAPLVSMGAGENANQVTIPSVFISMEDCQLIKDEISANRNVSITIEKTKEISSALDNGIVAHEYGHGISVRLVGGASNSNCLSNDEQMGEGWSDFFALVLTRKPEDRGPLARGIGTYALGQDVDGRGIRRYQYSTDMSINPQTHSHIRATSTVHPLGEVWLAALWDMYWIFVDAYGYDENWEDRSSGNFRAVQNVIDGMKIQPCDASLLEARDAIITADALNYLSEGECLIWQAFARRGMGENAIGGNANWRYDNIDGFEIPASCSTLPIVKRTATPIIELGDEIEVTIEFIANNVALNDITITEFVPLLADPGLRFGEVLTPGVGAEVDGARITFSFDNVADPSLSSIRYSLRAQGLTAPDFDFYEDFEGENNFQFETSNQDVEEWRISSSLAAEGQYSMRVAGNLKEGNAYATLPVSLNINDENSLLRFDNRYDAQLGFDGGQIEVSQDNGTSWNQIPETAVVVQPYRDEISYDFRYTQTEPAYTGLDTLWNTTIVDLSDYMGSEILIRFAYVQQDFLEIEAYEGWSIDNVEVFDRQEIIGSTCLNVNGVESTCDVSSTFVSSNAKTTPTIDILNDIRPMVLTPNPAIEKIWATFQSEKAEEASLRVLTIDGKVLYAESIQIREGQNSLNRDLSNLASGTYILEIRSRSGSLNQKFIKQ